MKNCVFITADTMGKGDEALGKALMKSYLYSLTEVDEKPETLVFVNQGVKLTTKGSEVMESLKQLEKDGVEILSCGACINYYGLEDDLLIGGITDMYSNVEMMQGGTNTIIIS